MSASFNPVFSWVQKVGFSRGNRMQPQLPEKAMKRLLPLKNYKAVQDQIFPPYFNQNISQKTECISRYDNPAVLYWAKP